MAITTLTQYRDGIKTRELFSKAFPSAEGVLILSTGWRAAGTPAPAAVATPGLAGESLVAPVVGQIPVPAAVSGQNIHLARIEVAGVQYFAGISVLDRLWQNSGLSVTDTTAQTVNSVAWPARDINGSTNGDGVLLGLDFSTAGGGSGTTATVSYTNSDGVAGRTGTFTVPATPAVGSMPLMALQAGDTGVRSVQTFQMTASIASGVMHLVALRLVAHMHLRNTASAPIERDGISLGMPRIYDNSVLFLAGQPDGTGVTSLMAGSLQFTQG